LSYFSLSSSSVLSGNEAILANQISGFDGLRIEVQRLTRLFRAHSQQPADQTNTQVTRNLQECVQSAEQLVSSASMIMSGRTTTAGGSEAGITMSERLRRHIANWIPEAASTIDEDDDHDTYATTSTFSQIDAETDDTATAHHGAPTTRTNVGQGIGHGRTEEAPDGPDPDILKYLIQHLRNAAKNKFDAGEYAASEKCLQNVVRRSEASYGRRYEWRDETLQLLALSIGRQGDWEEAETILQDLWSHPAEPRDHDARSQSSIRLKHAFVEVYFGKKDYANAEQWCHWAMHEIRRNLGMKHPLFYESIYFLVQVSQANGDPEEAEAYIALLPPGFIGMSPWSL
jgi:hypothetical protein